MYRTSLKNCFAVFYSAMQAFHGESAQAAQIPARCRKSNRGTAELLVLDKSGIAVAEYWSDLPLKADFEFKILEILLEAREPSVFDRGYLSFDLMYKLEKLGSACFLRYGREKLKI
ncbi:MAG: hypothetical protein LBU32_30115 [Clostridiales bacterium]|jgi:hypothetical protein|nr:hypothetical protein [Clostridiales bacterium]